MPSYNLHQMREVAAWYSSGGPDRLRLPFIHGKWYFVVPGRNSARTAVAGTDIRYPLGHLVDAYNKCTSGNGDGICLVGFGTTTAGCTSYLSEVLDWTKYGITVVGVSAPGYNMRSRISNLSTVTDLAYLIDVQGKYNSFYNVSFVQGGSNIAAVSNVKVTGNGNHFSGCHFLNLSDGSKAVALAAASAYGNNDCLVGASENTFDDCVFGQNTTIHAAANANLVLTTAQGQNFWRKCTFLSRSNTSGRGAIGLYLTSTLNGYLVFKNCTFLNWYESVKATALAGVVIGATQGNSGILMQNCGMQGWALWDANTANDCVYVTNSAGYATGGLGIVAS